MKQKKVKTVDFQDDSDTISELSGVSSWESTDVFDAEK